MQTSPSAAFDSRDYPPECRLSAFREMTASVYDAGALENEKNFMVETFGYRVNQLMFTDFKCGNARFQRTRQHLQGRDLDFLVLHAQLSGEELLHMEHGIIRLLPDNIYLRDWAYPFDSQSNGMHIRSVLIPRQLLASSTLFSVHNPILSWPMSDPTGALLWNLWSQIFEELSRVDLGIAEVLSRGFLGFLNGLVTMPKNNQMHGHPRLHAMEYHIQTQLRGDVNVENLCNHFHLSRATVFRLFKEHGGLKHYVDRLRLEHCYSELKSSDPGRITVGEVAAGWGYDDPKTFNRKFRSQFGVAPSKVLGTGFDTEKSNYQSQNVAAEHGQLFRNFKRWMADASGSDNPKQQGTDPGK